MIVDPILFVVVALIMLIFVTSFLLYVAYSSLGSDRHRPSLEEAT